MANRYVLGADIRVTGNYKSQLNTFLNAVKRCEREFDNFTKKVVKDSKTIDASLTQMTKTVLQYANSMSQTEKKAVTTSNALQEKMGKSVDKLGTKYDKLGKQIKDAYANIPSEIPQMNPSNTGGKGGKSTGESSALLGLLSPFKSMLLGFVSIQTAIKTIQFYLKTANDIANKISGGIFSLGSTLLKTTNLNPESMMNNAMDYETIRATMDVLAKSEERGEAVYKSATNLAKNTAFSVKDMTESASMIMKVNLLPSEFDLEQIANIGALKPELGAEHVGFAIKNWLNGNVTSLKKNYGVDNETLKKFLKTLPNKQDYAKAFTSKGVVNDKEQAFNLLMQYISSNYDGLALTQSKTLRGRFDTLMENFDLLGSSLMGLDSEKGKITNENGVYNRVSKFIGAYDKETDTYSGLMKTIEDFSKSPTLVEFQNTLGSLVGNLLELFGKVTNMDNLENFVKMFSNIGASIGDLASKFNDLNIMQQIIDVIIQVGNEFADMVKTFAQSEQYESFLKQLPELIKQSLDLEMAKMKLAMSLSAHSDVIIRTLDKMTNFIDWITGASDVGAENKDKYNAYEDKAILSGENSGVYGWMPYFKNSTRDVTLHDEGLTDWLEEQGTLYMSQDEKDKVKNYINNDNKTSYDIQLQYHNGKYDREQLVRDLLALLDEADSNS